MEQKKYRCPYCEQSFDTEESLSKHIDMAHIGKGLLEGDRRKWQSPMS
ncbi:MAG: C2H2-type zinc finger protein [Thaumarchaeota archaeon]|nr:C2H2-type zinc finger protein [Candidatus Terraquivivens yellowstonensis]MCL7387615.1 C2H2-type zinc finger protein [Candidatus Terraquivivens yellowstonensis]MCL7392810.1 C2H2-type zinc finger protein [Candidatus Terraquivivens yellowstonensis]MCL7395457.1 C2H2-type zinc finger protein [Candidatus Terraquivivens yellowstonensis]MCL7398561.1 C2H2-type zinc finger protein [Candidatus Terraquivivens yellowstonensis]